jgi:hypothetical protein
MTARVLSGCAGTVSHRERTLIVSRLLSPYLGVLREGRSRELRAHADDPPGGHRRCAAPPCQCQVSAPDERAHAGGDCGRRVNGGRRDGLLSIRNQAFTYLGSRRPGRARTSTFCIVDECGYGDNREAASKTRSRFWTRLEAVRRALGPGARVGAMSVRL